MNKFLLSILILLPLLSSCGFKLKGQYYLPDNLKTLHLTSSKKFSPLKKQLKHALKMNQVSLTDTALVTLHIHPEQFQRRTLSLFANGQVAEYELIYIVKFELINEQGQVTPYQFELSREFQDDPNNPIAKDRERELILNELRRTASERILSQLAISQ